MKNTVLGRRSGIYDSNGSVNYQASSPVCVASTNHGALQLRCSPRVEVRYRIYDCLAAVCVKQVGTVVIRLRLEAHRRALARPTRPRALSYPAERQSSSSTKDSNRSASTLSADRVLSWYCPTLITCRPMVILSDR